MIPDTRFKVISADSDLSLDTVLAEVERIDTGVRYFAKSRGFSVPLSGLVKDDFDEAIEEVNASKLLGALEGVPSVHESGVVEMLGNVYVYFISDLCSRIGNERFCSDRDLLRHILETVEGIHRMGIIHNDITPWNIMRFGDRPVVIDFGNSSKKERRINSFSRKFVDPSRENDISMAIKTACSISCLWRGKPRSIMDGGWENEIREMDIDSDLIDYCIEMVRHEPSQDIDEVGGAGSLLYHIYDHSSGGDLADH